MQTCSLDNLECIPCKSSNKIWIIVDPKTEKLYRCTFSQSLAHHIVDNHFPDYEVRRVGYRLGKVLADGEKSRGLYAVMSSKKHIVLRCEGIEQLARMKAECDSRYLQEIFLVL